MIQKVTKKKEKTRLASNEALESKSLFCYWDEP